MSQLKNKWKVNMSQDDVDYAIKNMPDLAPRRHQAISLLANGYTTSEAAKKMGISMNSIHNNLILGHRMYGTRTTLQLIAKAVHAGIIEFEDA